MKVTQFLVVKCIIKQIDIFFHQRFLPYVRNRNYGVGQESVQTNYSKTAELLCHSIPRYNREYYM